jgi:hypothetical protein
MPDEASISPMARSLSSLKWVATMAIELVELIPAPVPQRNFQRKEKRMKD